MHLEQQGLVAAAPIDNAPRSPAQCAAKVYANYLRDVRNLAPATIRTSMTTVRMFLTCLFAEAAIDFKQLTRESIIKFVRSAASRRCHGTTRRVIADLRAFLRYAYHRG